MSMSGAGVEGRYLQRDPTPILLANTRGMHTHTHTHTDLRPTPDGGVEEAEEEESHLIILKRQRA